MYEYGVVLGKIFQLYPPELVLETVV